MIIRNEHPEDIPAVRTVITDAFKAMPYSNQTEVAILDGLRAAGALVISLVAIETEVVGHIAFSPVSINDAHGTWYGAGPVAVRPDRQRTGIGKALVLSGLDRLKALGAEGCVLVGDPKFYGRFGFKAHSNLRLADVPPEYFLALAFNDEVPGGVVRFHPAFSASGS